MAKQAVAPTRSRATTSSSSFRSIQEDVQAKVERQEEHDRRPAPASAACCIVAARVPPRPAQRQEEDHPRRDPAGLSHVQLRRVPLAAPHHGRGRGSFGGTAWPRASSAGNRRWQVVALVAVRRSVDAKRAAARGRSSSPSTASSRAQPLMHPRRSPAVRAASSVTARSCVGRGARERGRSAAYGERVLLLDAKRRRYLVMLARAASSTATPGTCAHDDLVGATEGTRRALDAGRRVHGAAPDARGLRGRDAARRAGDLPEGPRADLHAGRHRARACGSSSPASGRARCRWRCCGTAPTIVGYELREDFANRARANVRQLPRRRGAGPLPRRGARQLRRASTPTPARSTGWCSTCPSRGRWSRTPNGCCAPGGILVAYTPAITQATQAREALRGRVDRRPHVGGAPPRLAHRGPGGASRPPHGGPHRVPDGVPACLARSAESPARRRSEASQRTPSITARCRCTRRGTPRRTR